MQTQTPVKKFYLTKKRKIYRAVAIFFCTVAMIEGIFLSGMLFGQNNIEPIVYTEVVVHSKTITDTEIIKEWYYPSTDEVIDEIVRVQKTQSKVSLATALRIGSCESGFDAFARNKSGSTAKGVYQWTDPTWKKQIKMEKHQFDYKENIKQFFIHYPEHKGWWECK